MNGYNYLRVHVTDEAVNDVAIDVLAYALEQLRVRSQHEGNLTNPQTVILPPGAHPKSDERQRGLWTVALTDNPSDFVRRLVQVGGYGLDAAAIYGAPFPPNRVSGAEREQQS